MNDKEYFQHYKDSFSTVFSSHTEDLTYIKDDNFTYQAMTQKMLNLFGVDALNEVIGRSTEDLLESFDKNGDFKKDHFAKQDNKIKEAKKRGVFLNVMLHNGVPKIFILHKTPIINPTTGNCVGIRGQIQNLLWPNMIKTLFKIHGNKGLLLNKDVKHNPFHDYPLTNMQHMVLFFCLSNYSYSEIALFMSEFGHNITPIRVNDYLEQLKLIFHVRTKNQLIEKAIGLNFHVCLPGDLFNRLSSIEISNETASIICGNCKLDNCDEHRHVA